MAEKDANNSSDSPKNQNKADSLNSPAGEEVGESCDPLNDQNKEGENESFDLDSYLSFYESPVKREENPFSFKKFLNQDSSAQRNKGARKKVYAAASATPAKSDLSDHSLSKSSSEMNSRVISTSDVSSVLPDFVQDHLVIEQCYLNGSSTVNIDTINLQNLPDLNLEHQNFNFNKKSDRNINRSKMSSNQFSNLPDFTLGVRNFQSVTQGHCNSERLPDFTFNANAASSLESANESNASFIDKTSRRRVNVNETNDTASHSARPKAQISSSPSVPLDLPSFENSNESNSNMPIPFDLTIPADDNNSSNRNATAPEAVSKSLPDFLSDGPIKKEMDDNLKTIRGNSPPIPNGLLFSETPALRSEYERLIREVDSLRSQLSEKNRRLEILESELEHLHSTDQRETANLEYAFKEVESNLKQTTKRASHAEDMVMKLKQENKMLKFEVCSLKSENKELRLRDYESQMLPPSQENKNQKIAKELRAAANSAETSLRQLLGGIENLRLIASSMENVFKFQDSSEDYQGFLQEDSASGPAL